MKTKYLTLNKDFFKTEDAEKKTTTCNSVN